MGLKKGSGDDRRLCTLSVKQDWHVRALPLFIEECGLATARSARLASISESHDCVKSYRILS
jgi:hypothetical protein